jgi:CRISPR-associated protein (TIGR03986 family)
MFGYLKGQSRDVLRGRVLFTDAVAAQGVRDLVRPITLERFGQPKMTHTAFYRNSANQSRGRKFYWHQPAVNAVTEIPRQTRQPHANNVSLHPMEPGASFSFSVRYAGLSEDELGLLLWTLQPGASRRHKIGFGKGVGMGSVRINVNEWNTAPDPMRRYSEFEPADLADPVTVASSAKAAFVRSYAARIGAPTNDDLFALPDDNLADLGPLLTPQTFPQPVQYPTFEWFRQRSTEPLPTVAETLAGHYLPDLPVR